MYEFLAIYVYIYIEFLYLYWVFLLTNTYCDDWSVYRSDNLWQTLMVGSRYLIIMVLFFCWIIKLININKLLMEITNLSGGAITFLLTQQGYNKPVLLCYSIFMLYFFLLLRPLKIWFYHGNILSCNIYLFIYTFILKPFFVTLLLNIFILHVDLYKYGNISSLVYLLSKYVWLHISYYLLFAKYFIYYWNL